VADASRFDAPLPRPPRLDARSALDGFDDEPDADADDERDDADDPDGDDEDDAEDDDPEDDALEDDPDAPEDADALLDEDFPLGDGVAERAAVVHCPYCGEASEVAVDPGGGAHQDYVEDCPVCCRPWRVTVAYQADGTVDVWAHTDDE
jgi:hypothetical protein